MPILIVAAIAAVIGGVGFIYNAGKTSVKNEVIKYDYQDLFKSTDLRERAGDCYDHGGVFNAKTGECK